MKTIYVKKTTDLAEFSMIISGVEKENHWKDVCICSLPEGWEEWKSSNTWCGDWAHIEFSHPEHTSDEKNEKDMLFCVAALVKTLYQLGCPGLQITAFGGNLWDKKELKALLRPEEPSMESKDVMYCLLDKDTYERTEATLKNVNLTII